ncbi:carbohydrate ABC transporter permease [Aeropyrum camini]|uniref:ABC transporter permease n=1 Tax=Aeropyrum camini SY1 = JCM 12091 TaxID=1198449 RepID=U3TBS2_9CREN|nr:carbohydrate ABC transporter permease [Aeropyrum camini]BAN89495.1 ABC transporter permease [Aeropyrum camini SY1 = JCM 12091]
MRFRLQSRRLMRLLRVDIILINIIAWCFALVWLLPFIGVFMVSVRPYGEVIVKGWWNILDATFTMDNYIKAWSYDPYSVSGGYINSLIVALPATIVPVAAASLAAYGFSRFSFPLRSYLFLLIILLMALPQQIVVVPLFLLLKDLRLINTFPGIILVHSAWGMAWITFFMKNFFDILPREVEEAARVDGASDFKIFYNIVLPMSLPGILSASVLQFTWVWSSFFFELIFLIDPEKWVITQRIANMKGTYFVDWGLIAAGSVFAMAVPLAVYMLLQRYYIRGFVGWAVKG